MTLLSAIGETEILNFVQIENLTMKEVNADSEEILIGITMNKMVEEEIIIEEMTRAEEEKEGSTETGMKIEEDSAEDTMTTVTIRLVFLIIYFLYFEIISGSEIKKIIPNLNATIRIILLLNLMLS